MDVIIAAPVLLLMLIGTSSSLNNGCQLTVLSSSPCVGQITCSYTIDNLNSLISNMECRKRRRHNYYYNDNIYETTNNYKLRLIFNGLNTDFSEDPIMLRSSLANVETLTVTNGSVTTFPQSIYDMTQLTDLEFIGNKIDTINMNKFSKQVTLEKINVSHNFISDLETESEFTLATNAVKTIDLSYNLIEFVPDNCFSRFPQLHHLNFSHNLIKSFDILTFEGVLQLESLHLSNNKIIEIGLNFARFVNMKDLSLDHNHLTSLIEPNFGTMSRLERLNISSNNIEDIEVQTFQKLSHLSLLDLSHNQVSVIPKALLKNNVHLQSLYLSHNKIEVIESGAFDGKNLTSFSIRKNCLSGLLVKGIFQGIFVNELDLSGENITTLGSEAFSDLYHLRVLNLSSNLISNISETSFISLTLLTELDLSNNKLRDIKFHMEDLKNLSFLNFKGNYLKTITKNTLKNLTSLTKLDLSNNSLDEIEFQSFKYLKKLETLILNNNILSDSIKAFTFKGLVALENIELINTRITSYQDEAFSGMKSLKILNSTNGELSSISYNVFLNTGAIEIIDLSHNLLDTFFVNTTSIDKVTEIHLNNNKITNITNETFSHLVSLRKLNLAFNNIVNVDSEAFHYLQNVFYLNLASNIDMNISSNIFDNLSSLLTISLKNVRRRYNFEQASNTSIRDLDMSSCHIDNINSLFVFKIKNIYKVDLNSNKISFIDKFSFQAMPSLTWLDLSLNLISQIQPGSFINMHMLQNLNLYGNNLPALQFGIFDGLNNLRTLNLSNNAIHNIEADIFHNNPHIGTIILDDNAIKNINFYEFALRNITKISIGGNPIPCGVFIKIKTDKPDGFIITAEKLDYHSENVDGIKCETITKVNKTIIVPNTYIQEVNATQGLTALNDAIESFRDAVERFARKNVGWNDSLESSLKNVSGSIDNFVMTVKRSDSNSQRSSSVSYVYNEDVKNILYFIAACLAVVTVVVVFTLVYIYLRARNMYVRANSTYSDHPIANSMEME